MCHFHESNFPALFSNLFCTKKSARNFDLSRMCAGSSRRMQISSIISFRLKNKTFCKSYCQNIIEYFFFFFRADCSNVDKADGKPEHNGLSSFGKVRLKTMLFKIDLCRLDFHHPAPPPHVCPVSLK